jgi:proton-dependent oligopeptide transporter, POT family
MTSATPTVALERHPPGLVVLFLTEMWERFSFYSMVSMFVLYMTDAKGEGFGWTKEEATALNSNYQMFVYASPLIGGLIADRALGFLRCVLIGGVFFMVGHLLLSFRSIEAVYAALTCLVIGNGFFKPNVSSMVGNLYPQGGPLKERAYSIFYMGINVGACAAPIAMHFIKKAFGFHVAFAVAAGGMVISVLTLWFFRHLVQDSPSAQLVPPTPMTDETPAASGGAVTARRPAAASSLDAVPDWMRVGALIVVYFVVIVFWMVFHQNSSTLTYWAEENTNWEGTGIDGSGILAGSINGAWVIVLTFPLIAFWGFLNRLGLEPSTPAKMVIGMFLTGASFFLLYYAALGGEAAALDEKKHVFAVSVWWLIASYGVVTLGELMLSPMGLALVSKVSPPRLLGVMFGGWFVATAIGNKLTMIGVYWEYWLHSSFFALCGGLAVGMGVFLLLILPPLKKAMPGV